MADSAVVLAVVSFLLAQAGLALEARRRADKTDGKIDAVDAQTTIAATEAALAAKLAEPTGKIFAGKVLEGLEEIKVELHTVRTRLDTHINDHASSDVRRR